MADLKPDSIMEDIKSGKYVQENMLILLFNKLKDLLLLENNIVELASPITIVGDIHGQLYDMLQMFDKSNSNPLRGNKFLFLGDYVDRGRNSIETFSFLASMKVKFPKQVFLLRGNHECRQINQAYGFYSEIMQKYGHSGLWTLCNQIFDLLPVSSVIDNKLFCVHGGLSPKIKHIEAIELLNRNGELPTSGPLCDLCWSDPDSDSAEWKLNERGAGYQFGMNQVNEFCKMNSIDCIVRSHQLVQEGYHWYFGNKLVTIWSAPNYMYRAGNKAVYMRYEQGQEPSFVFFEPSPKSNTVDTISESSYFA